MKHILIDVDGVMIKSTYKDDTGIHYYWQKDLEKDFGIKPTVWSTLFDADFVKVICGKMKLEDKVNAFLSLNYPSLSAAEIINYWMEKDNNLNENILPWIKRVRELGHKVHIASNQEPTRINYLTKLFEEIIDTSEFHFYSSQLNALKKEPDFFLKAMKALKASPQTIWFIDDDLDNIETAKRLGINTFLFDINDPSMTDKLNEFLAI